MVFAFEIGLTAGATGQHGVLTPPRHLIPPPAGPGSVLAHLFILHVTPACVSRRITFWYPSHFIPNATVTHSRVTNRI